MMEDDFELAEIDNNQGTGKEDEESREKQFDLQCDSGQVNWLRAIWALLL